MCRKISWILLCFSLIYGYAHDVEVNVKQGKILGVSSVTIFDGRLYNAFYGIPYARKPIGKLRFKNPKRVEKWVQPFDARTEFYGACAQTHVVRKHSVYGYEDCLRLNIYTPLRLKRDASLKAVIVWFHGHAFTSSFSHLYGPDFFIDNDVILITVTYRVGPFGFLKLNDTDLHANMGLKDIIMALKWIKENIEHFGGNENNIVVMGSNSGATYLSLILTTKYSKLFNKLILQSGSMFSSHLFQGDHILEREKLMTYLKSKGYNSVLDAPTKLILEIVGRIYNKVDVMHRQRTLIPFLPIIERYSKRSLLTSKPDELFHKFQVDAKTILIGFNNQESITEVIPFLRNPYYLKMFQDNFKFLVPFARGCKRNYGTQIYQEIANHIKSAYFKVGLSEKSIDDLLMYISHLSIYPIYYFIQRYLHLNGSKMFIYKFSYNGNLNAVKASATIGIKTKVHGAASGDELCYLFRCEPMWENYIKVNRDKTKDRTFIKEMSALWANFAKFGDPTPNTYKGNVTWPPTYINDVNILSLGKVIRIVDDTSEKRMYKFWSDIYHKYYENCKNHDEL